MLYQTASDTFGLEHVVPPPFVLLSGRSFWCDGMPTVPPMSVLAAFSSGSSALTPHRDSGGVRGSQQSACGYMCDQEGQGTRRERCLFFIKAALTFDEQTHIKHVIRHRRHRLMAECDWHEISTLI